MVLKRALCFLVKIRGLRLDRGCNHYETNPRLPQRNTLDDKQFPRRRFALEQLVHFAASRCLQLSLDCCPRIALDTTRNSIAVVCLSRLCSRRWRSVRASIRWPIRSAHEPATVEKQRRGGRRVNRSVPSTAHGLNARIWVRGSARGA